MEFSNHLRGEGRTLQEAVDGSAASLAPDFDDEFGNGDLCTSYLHFHRAACRAVFRLVLLLLAGDVLCSDALCYSGNVHPSGKARKFKSEEKPTGDDKAPEETYKRCLLKSNAEIPMQKQCIFCN